MLALLLRYADATLCYERAMPAALDTDERC